MWRHSVDGRAYQRWSQEAISVLARLELLNDIWCDGWVTFAATSLGQPIDVAVVCGVQRTVARTAVIAGGTVAILGLLMRQEIVVDVGLAALAWVGIAQWRQGRRDAAAKAERTAVLGFDPTDRRALPPWSNSNAQVMTSNTLITGIRMLLSDAGRSFPAQSYLPLLEIPPVQPLYLPEAMHSVVAAMHEAAAPHRFGRAVARSMASIHLSARGRRTDRLHFRGRRRWAPAYGRRRVVSLVESSLLGEGFPGGDAAQHLGFVHLPRKESRPTPVDSAVDSAGTAA